MLVLIVEDEVIVGLMLALELRTAGYRVCGPVGFVYQAIQLAENESPDVAFVDINLEGDAEGLDVARALHEHHGTTCIFVTAWPEQAREAKNAAIGVIEKPFLPQTVARAAAYAAAVRTGRQLPPSPRGLALLQ